MQSKRRIALVANSAWNILNFRGALLFKLAEEHDVVVLAPSDRGAPELLSLGARHVPVPIDSKGISPVRDLLYAMRLWRALRRERPAALLGFTPKPNIYGSLAARLAGVPVVNNISGLGTAFIRESWLTYLVKRLYRLALARSYRVFFQNPDDRDLFLREGLVREEQCAMLPGSGVDLEKFKPREAGADGPFVFLLVARLLRDKGIHEYVNAARIVRRTRADVRFQLLGFLDVENRTAITRAEVDGWVAEGIAEYLGETGDVRPQLAAATVVVLPSYREGTPRSLLEAAAMAKPIVATDVPGCREVVDHGVNGLLCRPRDPADLAARMLDLLALTPEARAEMGRQGRLKMERQFDEALVIARYRETLWELLHQ